MANSIQKSIKKNIVIGNNTVGKNRNLFHITYGTDQKFQYGVGVSIVSVLINNTSKNFVFHIFTDECSDEYRNKLHEISVEYATCINVYIVDALFFENFPSTKVWSYAMYYRLLAYDYLYSQADRVLYLDADVMCGGNISELYSLDFGDNIVAVVDDLPSTSESSIKRLGSLLNNKNHYFNSGMMLVDLEKWHENKLTNRSLEMLTSSSSNQSIKYPDQDVLNILLSGTSLYLERKYNTIYTLKSELKDKTHKAYCNLITDDTVFVHFTGITKPWHVWADYASRAFFIKARGLSPWRNQPLISAESLPEMQKQYKHLFAQRKYFRGFSALIKYKLRK